MTGSYDYDNSQNTFPPASFALYAEFLDQADTRQALHVGTTPFGTNASDAEKALESDFMRSPPATSATPAARARGEELARHPAACASRLPRPD